MTDDLPTPADRQEHPDTPDSSQAHSPHEGEEPQADEHAEDMTEEPTPVFVDAGGSQGLHDAHQDQATETDEEQEEQAEEEAGPDEDVGEEEDLRGEEDEEEGLEGEEEGLEAHEEGEEGEEGEEAPEAPPPSNKRWYVVKVQSGREESIKDAIERRVKIEGLEEFFGQIIIPVERIPEIRRGKRIEKEHKLYPGYLMVEVEFNDRILYLFRETSGVGDFVGGGVGRAPSPMSEREVERMLARHTGGQADIEAPKLKIKPRFSKGDRLRVREGAFSGMEGEVVEILEDKAKVKLELTIIGRTVPVELEYYEVEPV